MIDSLSIPLNPSAPFSLTAVSGSLPLSSMRNFTLLFCLINGKQISSALIAAFLPALSASKQNVSSLAFWKMSLMWLSVVAVPSVANAFPIPYCDSPMTSVYPSTRMTSFVLEICCLPSKRP